jgi:hypothetical protein
MENLPARVPQALFPDLVSAFVPPDTSANAALELVIIIEGENIPTREFAAYLALIDRVYGRLSPEGLRSYAHREWGRLEIAEIHKSDLEIIFRVTYSHAETATIIVILLFLRSLPNVIKLLSESAKNFAEAYKAIEEGRLAHENRSVSEIDRATKEEVKAIEEARAFKEAIDRKIGKEIIPVTGEESRIALQNRRRIREVIWQESAVDKLGDARKTQLTTLLDALFIQENDSLSAPIRFARRQVKKVLLRMVGGGELSK